MRRLLDLERTWVAPHSLSTPILQVYVLRPGGGRVRSRNRNGDARDLGRGLLLALILFWPYSSLILQSGTAAQRYGGI